MGVWEGLGCDWFCFLTIFLCEDYYLFRKIIIKLLLIDGVIIIK